MSNKSIAYPNPGTTRASAGLAATAAEETKSRPSSTGTAIAHSTTPPVSKQERSLVEKREYNRLNAARARKRKKDQMISMTVMIESLENTHNSLLDENQRLKSANAKLKLENQALRQSLLVATGLWQESATTRVAGNIGIGALRPPQIEVPERPDSQGASFASITFPQDLMLGIGNRVNAHEVGSFSDPTPTAAIIAQSQSTRINEFSTQNSQTATQNANNQSLELLLRSLSHTSSNSSNASALLRQTREFGHLIHGFPQSNSLTPIQNTNNRSLELLLQSLMHNSTNNSNAIALLSRSREFSVDQLIQSLRQELGPNLTIRIPVGQGAPGTNENNQSLQENSNTREANNQDRRTPRYR